MQRKIRVLVGKPGLDGHDRGAKVVAAALRDAGMEVIYTGLHQTPAQIVEAAVQEDVDVVALSILSGAHMTLFPEVLELMRARGVGDRLLTGGGIIPPEDMESLARLGVGRLFGPGASTQEIARYIREWFETARPAEPAPAASKRRGRQGGPPSRPPATAGGAKRGRAPLRRAAAKASPTRARSGRAAAKGTGRAARGRAGTTAKTSRGRTAARGRRR